MSDVSDDGAPGWEAIDAACERAHPGIEPMHWGTIMRWRLGGDDPLDGTSAYPIDGPEPHWHYVSYGLSELYEKESDNLEESGWGFELTFRLARTGDEVPMWPLSLLQNIARYVFNSGNWFEPGHHIDLNGPIALDEDTELVALVMAEDPELGTIDTPNGRVVFVQCVGITADELEVVRQWDAAKFLTAVGERTPLLVTDPARPSYLEDPAFAAIVRSGVSDDGSSMASLVVPSLGFEEVAGELVVRIAANAIDPLLAAVPGRLSHGRTLDLESDDVKLRLEPGEPAWRVDEDFAVVSLPPASIAELDDGLRPAAGTYRLASLPGVVFEVS